MKKFYIKTFYYSFTPENANIKQPIQIRSSIKSSVQELVNKKNAAEHRRTQSRDWFRLSFDVNPNKHAQSKFINSYNFTLQNQKRENIQDLDDIQAYLKIGKYYAKSYNNY